MFHFIPSSFVYYISGIFVAVSVNLITSSPMSLVTGEGDVTLIILSVPWLVCSVFLTLLAISLESAQEDYLSNELASLSIMERSELKKAIYTKLSFKLRLWTLLILVTFVVGIYASAHTKVMPQSSNTKDSIINGSSTSPIDASQ